MRLMNKPGKKFIREELLKKNALFLVLSLILVIVFSTLVIADHEDAYEEVALNNNYDSNLDSFLENPSLESYNNLPSDQKDRILYQYMSQGNLDNIIERNPDLVVVFFQKNSEQIDNTPLANAFF